MIADYFSKKLFINDLMDVYPDYSKEDNHNEFLNESSILSSEYIIY